MNGGGLGHVLQQRCSCHWHIVRWIIPEMGPHCPRGKSLWLMALPSTSLLPLWWGAWIPVEHTNQGRLVKWVPNQAPVSLHSPPGTTDALIHLNASICINYSRARSKGGCRLGQIPGQLWRPWQARHTLSVIVAVYRHLIYFLGQPLWGVYNCDECWE